MKTNKWQAPVIQDDVRRIGLTPWEFTINWFLAQQRGDPQDLIHVRFIFAKR